MSPSLLPPNASRLERAFEGAVGRLDAIAMPLPDLWNPATCPAELLPWLAWALSIDRWDPAWTDADKRFEIARAIELQRTKGTPAAVQAVLDRYDELLELVEWFEASPPLEPHRFQVVLPLQLGGGDRSRAEFAERIIREIFRVKPLRSHLEFIQSLLAVARLGPIAAARCVGFVRVTGTVACDESEAWSTYLTTELGEPLQDEDGSLLQAMDPA